MPVQPDGQHEKQQIYHYPVETFQKGCIYKHSLRSFTLWNLPRTVFCENTNPVRVLTKSLMLNIEMCEKSEWLDHLWNKNPSTQGSKQQQKGKSAQLSRF